MALAPMMTGNQTQYSTKRYARVYVKITDGGNAHLQAFDTDHLHASGPRTQKPGQYMSLNIATHESKTNTRLDRVGILGA